MNLMSKRGILPVKFIELDINASETLQRAAADETSDLSDHPFHSRYVFENLFLEDVRTKSRKIDPLARKMSTLAQPPHPLSVRTHHKF